MNTIVQFWWQYPRYSQILVEQGTFFHSPLWHMIDSRSHICVTAHYCMSASLVTWCCGVHSIIVQPAICFLPPWCHLSGLMIPCQSSRKSNMAAAISRREREPEIDFTSVMDAPERCIVVTDVVLSDMVSQWKKMNHSFNIILLQNSYHFTHNTKCYNTSLVLAYRSTIFNEVILFEHVVCSWNDLDLALQE